MPDLVSLTLSDEDFKQALALIEQLHQLFSSKTITLTKAQRQRLLRMGENNRTFAEKSLEYASRLTAFHPPYFNYEEMQRDMALYRQLNQIMQALVPVQLALEDTLLAAGSDVLSAAHVFYRVLKQASQVADPQATAAFSDLKSRFEGG